MYDDSNVGNIVIIQNIIFKDEHIDKNEYDHAFRWGRPCLIIYSDDEYDYFLPLTSARIPDKFRKYYYKIGAEDFSELNVRLHKSNSYIGLRTLYKKEISGYLHTIGKLNMNVYKDIVKMFNEFNSKDYREIAKSMKGR